MDKSTRVIGVDSKAGRRSRTGSTVTMSVTDLQAIECQKYYLDIDAGNEPSGKLKKISLTLEYEDDLMEDEKVEKVIVNIDDALTNAVDKDKDDIHNELLNQELSDD